MTTSPRTSYLAPDPQLPYCKGCGHTHVLRALDRALVELQLDPRDVAIVSDIGCVGLADESFDAPHTVHSLHGRSPALATGLALADSTLGPGRLKPIVLIGDGGATIGISHLIHAALVNAEVTVLVHNNFLYGMTGGQGSAFTPREFVTTTTPAGSFTPPLDLARLLEAAHASFLARAQATDHDLAGTIAAAIGHPGFAMVEILELCPRHAVAPNALTGKRLKAIADAEGLSLGVLRRERRPSFGTAYRERHEGRREERTARPPAVATRAALEGPIALILAGTAGERVQSAASLLCAAAVASGLNCTQKNDNPVTVGSGFSLSEVILSPGEIEFTGIEQPDVIIVVSEPGLTEVRRRGVLQRVRPDGLVIAEEGLTIERGVRLPLRRDAGPGWAALAGVIGWLGRSGIIPVGSLADAARRHQANVDVDALVTRFAHP